MTTGMPKFTMTFEPMTIRHLGLRLYSTLPPVISELVSNAYDAEARKVEIQLPSGAITQDSEVVVRDFGHGMDVEEIQAHYLPIGRDRRDELGTNKSKNGLRNVTGRKGLGKLSGFGVAGEIEITAYKAGKRVCLRLSLSAIMQWAKEKKGQPFEPEVVKEKSGVTNEADGVEIRLRRLNRSKAISSDQIRRGLAQRLGFIGKHFAVKVNGDNIKPEDRFQREDCEPGLCWEIRDVPGGGMVGPGLNVDGWVGFVENSSQANRGVDIFASEKAVELGSFFNLGTTHAQFARAHLIGLVTADFLDDKDDLVATARNSVLWESEEGLAFEEWGGRVLRWAFDRWLEARQSSNEKKMLSTADFDKWLATRDPREQRVAQRLVKVLCKSPEADLPKETVEPLLEIVKNSVETIAFHDLVDALEANNDNDVERLLKLFEEWRVIEAREHLKLADGRVAALEQLHQFMEAGALEVTELQPLLVKNLWLIDPGWTEVDVQLTYTKILRDAKETRESKDTPESDRRLDIFAVSAGGIATIVELKRPEKTLSRKDLEQIEEYVDFARSVMIGSGPDSPKIVNGLLLVGKLSTGAGIKDKVTRLAGDDIRVQDFRSLYERSMRHYDEVEKVLKKVAPEYVKARKRKKS